MRQGFAGRHAEHVGPDRAAEQAAETVDGAAGFGEEDGEFVESLAVFPIHRVEAGVEAGERVAMAWEDEKVGWQRLELGDRGEPFAQRIGVRFGDAERDVGADPGQDLVAGDEDAAGFVEQARMFGAVARAGGDPPLARADRERVAVLKARVAERERRDDLAEPGPALGGRGRDLGIVSACAPPECEHFRRDGVAGIGGKHACGQPLAARHQQRCGVVVAHPAGKADMVGVEVRADHFRDADAGFGAAVSFFR